MTNYLYLTGRMSALLMKVLQWRESHIKERNFLLILAFFTGIFSGFAALLLKFLIASIASMLSIHLTISGANYLYLVYPVLGILIVGLYVRYVVKDNISHGVTRVLYAISQNKSRMKLHNTYTSVVASSITIGFGGSVGAEGPIDNTGAAIGSNLGSLFRMPPQILMMLVGSGAAAGVAAIFKAPIAGMLFAIEVLMIDLTTVSVMPLLVSSITAATISYIFTGYSPEFVFDASDIYTIDRIPYSMLLGVLCGFTSLYFTKAIGFMESIFSRIKRQWVKFAFGSVVLSSLIFCFPPLYGEGYGAITELLTGSNGSPSSLFDGSVFYGFRDNVWFVMLFLLMIVLTKVFATSATNGGGGVGGTFAPSLYVGCMTGFFFAFLLNTLGLSPADSELSCKNFALMGMAGVMSGVMHAPLMGIFLTAEMTGGYQLFLPLLIVSTISYCTIKIFVPYSIYTMRLAKRGELLTHHKDKAVLTLLKMDSVIETGFIEVHPDMSLRKMVQAISESNRNLFPVTDKDGTLLGVVLLDDIRNIMFRPDLYDKMYVRKFMSIPPAKIEVNESMENVMKTFDRTNAWNLPVVDADGKYIGFVSKSKIFNSYRRVLRHYSDD